MSQQHGGKTSYEEMHWDTPTEAVPQLLLTSLATLSSSSSAVLSCRLCWNTLDWYFSFFTSCSRDKIWSNRTHNRVMDVSARFDYVPYHDLPIYTLNIISQWLEFIRFLSHKPPKSHTVEWSLSLSPLSSISFERSWTNNMKTFSLQQRRTRVPLGPAFRRGSDRVCGRDKAFT